MKYVTKTLIRHSWAVAIGIGVLCASGMAQDSPAPEATKATKVATAAKTKDQSLEEKIQEYKVDISLTEPTKITAYIELIQEQVPTPLNIIVTRNSALVAVPPMRLRQVSVQAALNAAVTAAESEILWDFDDEEVIFIERDDGYFDESQETVTVVNASDILESTEEASLLSAIQIGLEMRDSSEKNVMIKLHKETKLLFVKGVEADINVVMQIVSELGGKPWPPETQSGGGGGADESGGGSRGGGGRF